MAPPPPKRLLTLDDTPSAPEWLEQVFGSINAHFQPTAEALDKGLTFGENFQGEVRDVTVLAPDDWVPVAFGTGYAQVSNPDFESSRYRKTLPGLVEAECAVAVTGGFGSASSNVMFTLPAAYAPRKTGDHAFIRNDGAAFAVAQTRATGEVFARFGAAGNGDYTLRTTWEAADRTPPRWATPVDVRLGTPARPFPGRPGRVDIMRALETRTPSQSAPIQWVDWTHMAPTARGDSGGIRIHRVWGLVPGVSYTLRLLVLPE